MVKDINMVSIFPVGLSIDKLKIALVGSGIQLINRLKLLDEAGANNIVIFAPYDISDEFIKISKGRHLNRMPDESEIQNYSLFMIAGIEDQKSFQLADMVRSYGKFVNVEDRKEYCDFYYSSIVRRGNLVIGVNTGGKSPALSRRIREFLEDVFPECWKERLEVLSKQRSLWKAQGVAFSEVIKKSYNFMDNQGWFDYEPFLKSKSKK